MTARAYTFADYEVDRRRHADACAREAKPSPRIERPRLEQCRRNALARFLRSARRAEREQREGGHIDPRAFAFLVIVGLLFFQAVTL